jgi:hypothetical protein
MVAVTASPTRRETRAGAVRSKARLESGGIKPVQHSRVAQRLGERVAVVGCCSPA